MVAKRSGGSPAAAGFRRYADDSVVCFERKEDAEAYLQALPGRLEKFGLSLAEEKSALVKFNRWEPDSSGRFTFIPPAARSAVSLRMACGAGAPVAVSASTSTGNGAGATAGTSA